MNTEITWRDRLRYRFENTLSKGPAAMIAWLAIVSTLMVLVAAFVIAIFAMQSTPDTGAIGFVEGGWRSLMHALDAGNLAGDEGWALRILE